MKNTIRCCISCILPCGALDVIRIVHSNGRVEEISGSIKASDIMKAYPKHVLKKPSSSSDDGMVPKIVIVPPDAELQRGKIYFLIPLPSTPDKTRSKTSSTTKKKKRDRLDTTNNNNGGGASSNGRNRQHNHSRSMSNANKNNNTISMSNLLISDQYLSEILSEKLSTQRDRRRGRVGVWRPHLESISESPNDG
ncbi:hypothetical protein ERO13_D06G137200v2 [Gossypium hirsutum]|uniref:Uncharacterized protein n=5 Tax=Gossypium TaxID=3633 RepID=A0A1U8IZM8_GOSHI|nr:uncharacterized protein LOC105774409 [Gossypium raimondii]XP_016681803.1 uncharacterized protein LOC107900644 [Gossypium hirsutum]MBA0694515.1 hypothetical protein [Gossypium aridum]TYH67219.1 hypothetical protein ES332_D06G173700v1 [Gossypium tomentosum]KAG4142567.1 hypothetical protein ERO13_D06G137200v2 [Gossypium hirsutum]KJB66812.1 hypothetical protein B456_010G159400 [Gossypium raimondii]